MLLRTNGIKDNGLFSGTYWYFAREWEDGSITFTEDITKAKDMPQAEAVRLNDRLFREKKISKKFDIVKSFRDK